MKTIHVIAGLEASDGGPSHTLPQLWGHLTKQKLEVSVYTTSLSETNSTSSPYGYEMVSVKRAFPLFLKWAPELKSLLGSAMKSAELCHDHGCWLYPNWTAGSLARKHS